MPVGERSRTDHSVIGARNNDRLRHIRNDKIAIKPLRSCDLQHIDRQINRINWAHVGLGQIFRHQTRPGTHVQNGATATKPKEPQRDLSWGLISLRLAKTGIVTQRPLFIKRFNLIVRGQRIGGFEIGFIKHAANVSTDLQLGNLCGTKGVMEKTLLSFGHGYSAAALARILEPKGWRIIGTSRSEEKLTNFMENGIEPRLWPGADMTPALNAATHLLISPAPTENGDPVLAELRDEITKRAAKFEWVGYLSTTGVYGDHDGGWVDENSSLTPATKRGQLRVKAESEWGDIPDLPLHIFRLAGIYGPGRGPFAKVRNGTARRIIKKGQVFSRIHVEDIAQVLAASIAYPNPGAAYNLCDDDPAPPQDVIGYAAELLGVPIPPAIDFEDADMSPMARSFYAESKKVRNDRIKDELGVTLKYPDYRAGLKALLALEQNA